MKLLTKRPTWLSALFFSRLTAIILLWAGPVLGVEKHALLIGIQNYTGTQFASLQGAYNDIELVRDLLTTRYGFNPENVRVLIDAQASHTKLEKAFANLADRVKPGDYVYIHYSGHGSYTEDLNSDEPSGMDQTWVPYGARPKEGKRTSLDHFDILDDELNSWLARINARTDNIIFASDSCHSGTITRGITTGSRTLPADTQAHPLSLRQFAAHAPTTGIRIGSARDDETASEFTSKEGKSYGLFTWNWVKALHETSPGDTWTDVFRKTRALMGYRRYQSQNPQMEGSDSDRVIFGSDFAPPSRTIPVLEVSLDNTRVKLGAGRIQGLTTGSVFGLPPASTGGKASLMVKITRAKSTTSLAEVMAGKASKGSMLKEISHAYPLTPIPVFITGDFPSSHDQTILTQIRQTLSMMPAYTLCRDQAKSEVVVYVLRPAKKNNRYIYASEKDSLPKSFPNESPQVWVLDPSENLLHKTLQIDLSPLQSGIDTLRKNLTRYARSREIACLDASKGLDADIDISAAIYRPANACSQGETCVTLGRAGRYRYLGVFSMKALAGKKHRKGDIITFTLKNNTPRDYYCYLISISPNGRIDTIFPDNALAQDAARLRSGQTLDMFKKQVGLELSEQGLETPKFIITPMPIDIRLLEQKEYTRSLKDKPLNPLERLLSEAGLGTRGTITQPLGSNYFGVAQETLEVIE